MKVVQQFRGQGKTTDMVLWLLQGHLIDGKCWSRILIVPERGRSLEIGKRLYKLWNQSNADYLNHAANSVFTVDQVRHFRGLHPDIELGVDDADIVLMHLLNIHRLPSIISVDGDPDTCTDPEKSGSFDRKG